MPGTSAQRPSPRDPSTVGQPPERSSERSYGRKIADLIAFLLPFLLIAGFALGGGGYDLFARHLAGALAWVLVIVLLLLPGQEPIRPGRSLALVAGLLLALAGLSAISSIWSSSVYASLAEFERVIGHLGIFLAGYLTLRTPKQREWFARGIATGIGVVLLLALGDRLVPGGDPAGTDVAIDRLSYPLGYWNGDGVVFACGVGLFLWLSITTRGAWWRALTVAMTVLSVTALYLTYSRGGILVTAISLVLLFFLSASRLRLLGTAAFAVAASVPILIAIDGYPAISGLNAGDPSVGESLVVAAVALVACGSAAAAVEGCLRLAGRRPELFARPLELSRDRRVLTGVAGAGVAAVLLLVLVFGNNAWNQFSDSDVPVPSDPKERFTELSGAWRYEFNEVSLDTFADNPLLGSGAGTYRFEWTLRRDVPVLTQNAHSFYLENLAELGLPGGLIAAGFALTLVWLAAILWRRRIGRDAPLYLALVTALFVSLAFDWFWKLGATAALLMLLAAWVASGENVDPGRRSTEARASTRVAGVIAAWTAIIVLAVPAVADRYVQASADSVRAGDVDRAIDQAHTASDLEPWNPNPHLQLGTIAISRGQTALALREIDRALELEPDNWRAMLLRFEANFDAGREAAARRDFARLREMNPVYFSGYTYREFIGS